MERNPLKPLFLNMTKKKNNRQHFRNRAVCYSSVYFPHLVLSCSCSFKNQRSEGCPERRFLTGRRVGWASGRLRLLLLFRHIFDWTIFNSLIFLYSKKMSASKGWSGKATASCFYTKDWSWVHSTGPAQKKKHWRSPQSSTNISCRDWKLLHAIRSRKSDRIRSYKILCKTEKIKKHLPIIISPEKELSTFHNSAAFIYSGVLSGPFTACG